MNLAEALNSALPELPARKTAEIYPQLHPQLIVREDVDQGLPIFSTLVRGSSNLFRFSPEQFKLIQLFDGKRSYEEISALYLEQTGLYVPAADIREFAASLDEGGFWYRSGHERNVLLMEKLSEQRIKRTKKKSKFDVAHMQFSAWDPNEFMGKVLPYVEFMYTGWAFAIMLIMLALMGIIHIQKWGEIWSDMTLYYTFTQKSSSDLAEFWLLFLVLGFFHESSHGLTCRHFGGEVHQMGFHLIYLAPAFFVDVTSAWVSATRWQRIMVVLAGIWIELVICAIATFVWWGTPAASPAHEWSYKIILLTGWVVVLVNMNPLIKLDGYYVLTELIQHGDLKESSTALVSSWVKKHIFRLPVNVEFVPRKRRPFYVIYAILSGIYSYGLLFAVLRFAYNVFHKNYAELAILPSGALALFIFRSRLQTLGRFMKLVYLDKKDHVRQWLTPTRRWIISAATLIILLTPIRRESVSGRFLLEPGKRAVVRASVPGTVVAVTAVEGEQVSPGQELLRLQNLELESQAANIGEQHRIAEAKAIEASMSYQGMGAARFTEQGLLQQEKSLNQKVAMLDVRSPIAGTVLTPYLRDKLGSYLKEGDLVAEIGDSSKMMARIYIPEYEIRHVRLGAEVHLRTGSEFLGFEGKVLSLSPASEQVLTGLESLIQYKGLRPPPYYVVESAVPNPSADLRAGMTGDAKIFASRRSLLYYALREIREFIGGKLW
jgi:putative peptide zinc metalloprotease protein